MLSAYSVKQMAAMLQYRMLEIQPDLVIMAINPQDFNLSRTPTIDAAGNLVDQKVGILLDSLVREGLRRVHLMYVLREIALPWFSPTLSVAALPTGVEIPDSYRYIRRFKETAEQHGLPYLVLLLPRMQEKAWGSLPDRLAQDGITYLDLSPLGKEFTTEAFMASRFDLHVSPAVHQGIGASLAEYVRNHQGTLP